MCPNAGSMKSESLLHGRGIEDFSALAHLLLLCDGLSARHELGRSWSVHAYRYVTRGLRLANSEFHPGASGRSRALMVVQKVPEFWPLKSMFSKLLGRVYSEVILSSLRRVSGRVGEPHRALPNALHTRLQGHEWFAYGSAPTGRASGPILCAGIDAGSSRG